MRKITIIICILLFLVPIITARKGVEICSAKFDCSETSDDVCPDSYGFGSACIPDDIDCCVGNLKWGIAGTIPGNMCCGNNPALEFPQNEKTYVITGDGLDSYACCDQNTDCVDDEACYNEKEYKDILDKGDLQKCINGVWHDLDESMILCTEKGFKWLIGDSKMNIYDNFDNDASNGYCNEEGNRVTGVVYEQERFLTDEEKLDHTFQMPFAPSSNADVIIYNANTPNVPYKTAKTKPDGTFSIDLQPGKYLIKVGKTRYYPASQDLDLAASQDMEFKLLLSRDCQPDCTKEGRCNAQCSGRNGCIFPDVKNEKGRYVKEICHNQMYGWAKKFNETDIVYCCAGLPQTRAEQLLTILGQLTAVDTYSRVMYMPDGQLRIMYISVWE